MEAIRTHIAPLSSFHHNIHNFKEIKRISELQLQDWMHTSMQLLYAWETLHAAVSQPMFLIEDWNRYCLWTYIKNGDELLLEVSKPDTCSNIELTDVS